jgi:hypothetical protein
MDANADGRITLADVLSWPSAVFFLPGDALLWATMTYAVPIARLLDVGPADYGGALSGTVSAVSWLGAFIGGAILYQKVRDLDQRLTSATARAYSTGALRLRIARTLLLQRWRAWLARRSPSRSIEVRTDVALSPVELEALRLHARLSAGFVLAVSEVASKLGRPPRAVERLLGKLKDLGLLVRASCGADGETGYALSTGGRALLDFHERAPETPASPVSAQSPPRPGAPARVGGPVRASAPSSKRR